MNKLNTGLVVVENILNELLSGLKSIIKEHLLGVYVYGSLVWGDFDETSSDIDVFVALNQEIIPEKWDGLDNLHSKLVTDFPLWNNRIEVAYASYKMLQLFKTEMGKIAVISPGEPFHIKNAGTDWLINFYLLQRKSHILYGPSPKSIIPHISKREFITHVKKQAIEWQDWIVHTRNSLGYQYYAVITLCRALYVIYNQEQTSKLNAGNWAKKQFPKWDNLIQRALTKDEVAVANQGVAEKTYKEVSAFTNEMVQYIQTESTKSSAFDKGME